MADLKTPTLQTDLAQFLGTEQIVKVDENKAVKYRVVAEEVDLEALRREKEDLETQLNISEPTKEELIELGKMLHSYYLIDREAALKRIAEIDKVLGG